MHVDTILKKAIELNASDVHLIVGVPPMIRLHGKLMTLGSEKLTPASCLELIKQMASEKDLRTFAERGEMDSAYAIPDQGRFRVNVYRERDICCAALRLIPNEVPSMETYKLPGVLKELARRQRGLILVTGPTGSGKTTTLAAMIDYMNKNLNRHVITIEDPIEYMYKHGSCVINQRQIGKDTLTFSNALRAALRQDPDVILVGEMRDLETISIALTAAETGHLVLSTLHTIGAAKTIDRVVDVFPPNQQQQIKIQLAAVLEAVISQQIIPRIDQKGRVVAFEIMVSNTAIRSLVREGKTHQLQNIIETSAKENMQTMDGALLALYRSGAIDRENALHYAVDTDAVMQGMMQGNRIPAR